MGSAVYCTYLILQLLTSFSTVFYNRTSYNLNWYTELDNPCLCGVNDQNMTRFGYKDGLWCCKTTNSECTVEYVRSERNNVTKCTGNAIPLTQQCHDNFEYSPVCNYYPTDRNRYRTFWEQRSQMVQKQVQRSFVDICNDNR